MMRLAILIAAIGIAACNEEQDVQAKYRTMASSVQPWPSESAALLPPDGVVAEGEPAIEAEIKTPPPVNFRLLERGRERFGIFCSPCHGLDGDAGGIIVARGFPKPPSFHSAALLNAPAQTFFDAITNGYGAMYSYADRIAPRDRWAIIGYIRALQLSQLQAPAPR